MQRSHGHHTSDLRIESRPDCGGRRAIAAPYAATQRASPRLAYKASVDILDSRMAVRARSYLCLRSADLDLLPRQGHQVDAWSPTCRSTTSCSTGRDPKKGSEPVKQREVAKYLRGHYDVSARRACRVIRATRSSTYYKTRWDPLTALRHRSAVLP